MLPQEDGNGYCLWSASPQPVEPMLVFFLSSQYIGTVTGTSFFKTSSREDITERGF